MSPRRRAQLTPLRLAFLLLLVFAAVHYIDALTRFLLVLYAAVVLAIAFNAIARRLPLGRVWAAAAMGLSIFALAAVGIWLLGSLLLDQVRSLSENLPQILAELDGWIAEASAATGLPLSDLFRRARSSAGGGVSGDDVVAGARSAIDFFVLPLMILFGGLFAVARPRSGLFAPVLRVLPQPRRAQTERAARQLAQHLTGWIRGQLLAMLAVGTLAFTAFLIIGVPYALLLGVINGLTEFIPIAGPFIGAIPAVIIAAVDEPMKGVWVAVAMTIVQQIESAVVTPLAMSTSARVHPFVTLFALFLFGSLFGLLGVLLAVPLVLLIATAVEVYWIEPMEQAARG